MATQIDGRRSCSGPAKNAFKLTVLVAWVVHVVISLVWFQPARFGTARVKLSGKELKPATRWIPAGLAAHLVGVLALAVITNLAYATTFVQGIALGRLVSIGFVGTMLAGELVGRKFLSDCF
jgi:hypothetical protein